MLYYKNLKETVLGMQGNLTTSNNIVIVSGYVGYQPIKDLCETWDGVDITIIYGMYGYERIKQPLHKALVEIQETYSNVTILYSTIPVHSKVYAWNCGDMIKRALVGSANFSVNGLMNDYKEILSDVEMDTFSTLKAYCDYVEEHAINCKSSEVEVRKIDRRRDLLFGFFGEKVGYDKIF